MLALTAPISFWGGVDPQDGRHHRRAPSPARANTSPAACWLLPGTIGSSSASAVLLELVHAGKAPAAILHAPSRTRSCCSACVVAREMGWATPPALRVPRERQRALAGRLRSTRRRGAWSLSGCLGARPDGAATASDGRDSARCRRRRGSAPAAPTGPPRLRRTARGGWRRPCTSTSRQSKRDRGVLQHAARRWRGAPMRRGSKRASRCRPVRPAKSSASPACSAPSVLTQNTPLASSRAADCAGAVEADEQRRRSVRDRRHRRGREAGPAGRRRRWRRCSPPPRCGHALAIGLRARRIRGLRSRAPRRGRSPRRATGDAGVGSFGESLRKVPR